MAKQRSEAEQQIADLLTTAKDSLRLSVAFLSRLDGVTQHLELVEASGPAALFFKEGVTQRQETSFCQAILDGRLPAVIPEVKKFPEAMKLPASRIPRIRSYVSVPVRLSDGSLYGTFCAAGLTSDKDLTKRDESLMRVLAHAASVIIEPTVTERTRVLEIEGRLKPLMHDGGPEVVLQPIVELASGRRVGAEALSRFPADWALAPDVVFEQAHGIGLGDRLELLALEQASRHLEHVSGYVAMNVSPATLLAPESLAFLSRLPLERILLELSEHDPVQNYPELVTALKPLRAQGMKVAIDDVGAGFSSLRHIVLTKPDVIKLDRSIVDGVAVDGVLQTLVRSLVDFGHGAGALVVAEGIETVTDANLLTGLGVDYGQGWYFGRPGPASALKDAVPSSVRVGF